jgi:hypothetical protein
MSLRPHAAPAVAVNVVNKLEMNDTKGVLYELNMKKKQKKNCGGGKKEDDKDGGLNKILHYICKLTD